MLTKYLRVLSISSVALASVLSLEDELSSDSNYRKASRSRSLRGMQPPLLRVGMPYDKDADDVSTFRELIGEARQIFKDTDTVCNNHNDDQSGGGGMPHLKLLGDSSSKSDDWIGVILWEEKRKARQGPPSTSDSKNSIKGITLDHDDSSIILLGDIFEVRDVVPDHDKFSDKISWVKFVSDNFKMDFLLTAKDRPFNIFPGERFAVTFREDNKFSKGPGPFKAGTFDHIMNGTLYKYSVSDSSLHAAKTHDILYVTFGDSFLKLRGRAGEFRYFKTCKQLYILFQKLAFK